MTREEMRDQIAAIIHEDDCSCDGGTPCCSWYFETADKIMAVLEDQALDRMADKLLAETNLRAMDFRNGMSMEIQPARALAANFVGAARAMLGEAPNYSETPVTMVTQLGADPNDPAAPREKFAFIVQRIGPGKLTPHEARMAAERRAEEAEAANERMRAFAVELRNAASYWAGESVAMEIEARLAGEVPPV